MFKKRRNSKEIGKFEDLLDKVQNDSETAILQAQADYLSQKVGEQKQNEAVTPGFADLQAQANYFAQKVSEQPPILVNSEGRSLPKEQEMDKRQQSNGFRLVANCIVCGKKHLLPSKYDIKLTDKSIICAKCCAEKNIRYDLPDMLKRMNSVEALGYIQIREKEKEELTPNFILTDIMEIDLFRGKCRISGYLEAVSIDSIKYLRFRTGKNSIEKVYENKSYYDSHNNKKNINELTELDIMESAILEIGISKGYDPLRFEFHFVENERCKISQEGRVLDKLSKVTSERAKKAKEVLTYNLCKTNYQIPLCCEFNAYTHMPGAKHKQYDWKKLDDYYKGIYLKEASLKKEKEELKGKIK